MEIDTNSVFMRDITEHVNELFRDVDKMHLEVQKKIKEVEELYKVDKEQAIYKILSNASNFDKDDPNKVLSKKHQLKAKLKAKYKNKKFKIGNLYSLQTKVKNGSKTNTRTYILKQIIWCIDDLPVESVVVKQISGPIGNIITMNIHDCNRLHVKYESGLQILPMSLNFRQIKNKSKNEN